MKKIFFLSAAVLLVFVGGCASTDFSADNDAASDQESAAVVNSNASVRTNTNTATVNANSATTNANINSNLNTNAAGNSNVNAAVDEDGAEPNPTADNEVNGDGEEADEEFQVKVGEVSADSATFVFSKAVRADEIDSAHIEHCIVSLSAVAVENNEDPDCTAATAAAGFSLDFDPDSQSVVVTNSGDTWGADGGPFQTGCASCVSAVRFTGLYTEDGDLVKTMLVEVNSL